MAILTMTITIPATSIVNALPWVQHRAADDGADTGKADQPLVAEGLLVLATVSAWKTAFAAASKWLGVVERN